MADISLIVRSYRSFNNSFKLFVANLTKEEELQEIVDFEIIEEVPQYGYAKQYRVTLVIDDLLYGDNEIAIKVLGEDGILKETTITLSNPKPIPVVPTVMPLSVTYTPVSPQTNHHRDIQLAWTSVVGYDRTSVFLGNSGSPKKVADQTGATYPVVGNMNLVAGETYSWKVDLHNDSLNQIIEGSVQWFQIAQAPGVPKAPFPAINSVDVDPASVVLAWTSDNPDSNIFSYDVYIGAGSSVLVFNETVTVPTKTITSLMSNKFYYWKVVVRDDKGNMVIGPVWKFKTQA